MNFETKWVRRTTVLSVAVFLVAFSASAAHATFDLPVEAHWGSVVLKPGKHSFDVPLASSWPQQISLTDNNRRISISAITELSGVDSDYSYLRLVAVGGTYFVQEYRSGPTGRQFTFWTPKPSHSETGESPGTITLLVRKLSISSWRAKR